MTRTRLLVLLAAALCVTACNAARGFGEDVRSVGRVFSHDPNGDHQRR